MNLDYPAIDTVGVEIELQNTLLTNKIKQDIQNNNWNIVRDASVETKKTSFSQKNFYSDINLNFNSPIYDKFSYNTFGGEIISQPSNPTSKHFIDNLEKVCKILSSVESYIDNKRSSVHIHINIGKNINLKNLKSIIRWATRVESIFYRIGSLQDYHRGIYNDFTYCRPLTLYGPSVIKTRSGKKAQIFNTFDLILSETLDDFFERYGDIKFTGTKYHPVRYHWLNLYSLNKYGTLEYRVFNQTLNDLDIRAIILLCQATTDKMLSTSYSELKNLGFSAINSVYNPLYNSREILEYILDEYETKFPTLVSRILDLFDYSEYPVIEKEYVISHMQLKNPDSRYFNGDYEPKSLTEGILVKEPNYIDIHNRGEFSIENVPNNLHLR